MITGDPMINKKKNTKKDDTSNSTVIKVMLLGFLIGNMIYAVIAFLTGDMQYIPEVLLKTGICLIIHIILLLGVTALEIFENRNWRIKNRVGTDLGSEYKTLKCSAFYYMMYICTFLLTLMLIAFLYLWYRDERETLIESYHNGGLTTGIVYMIFMYLVSIYCFFRYTCQKVFYTEHFIYHVSFFKKETVTWSQIQTIKYCYKKKKQKFVFTTYDHKTITLRSDILYDGWADFEEYVLDMADIYEIAIN